MVAVPVQVPGVEISVLPARVEPETNGAIVLVGATPVGVMLLLEVALALPKLFVPVTRQVIALPMSAATVTYVLLVAPEIVAPARSHWYVYVIVAEPVQVPVVDVSVLPSGVEPETVGATVLLGATPTGVMLLEDVALALP